MRKFTTSIIAISLFCAATVQAQGFAEKMAQTVMTIWKDSLDIAPGQPVKWRYDQAVILKGIEGLWLATGDKKYFDYIQKSMDFFVGPEGNIRTYKQADYNLDNVLPGRNLLMLYNVTGKQQYYKAALALREQLNTHPRISTGGFWHKKIYPHQMWLDGLYMAEPFYAEWSARFSEDTAFNDIARQFILMEQYSRDAKTGLLLHGYDESREQQWADKKTGRSPHVWARAMGWYGMALVDVLEQFPRDHTAYDSLRQILNRLAVVLQRYQDKSTGLWWDIVDLPGKAKNYPEASASSMFVYTLAKATRFGWIDKQYAAIAKKGFDGIGKTFIKTENGQTNLHGTVSVSGLGGKPYRDGSYEYYVGEPVIVNDPKGVGAFIQAANEMEIVQDVKPGMGKQVLLDYYFNHETKKDINGKTIQTHYTWEQMDNGGFSLLGNMFRRYGATTRPLMGAPTTASLQKAGVYIIVDPDSTSESNAPNYIEKPHIEAISNWVRNGGVLMLFANDSGNTAFNHLNQLASQFGISFIGDSRNRVQGTNFEQGAVMVEPGNPVFKSARKLYIKELSTLKVSAPATTLLSLDGSPVMAIAKMGKGAVFAVGDPWLYNEYVDGRKLPSSFQNFEAAKELVKWALAAAKAGKPVEGNATSRPLHRQQPTASAQLIGGSKLRQEQQLSSPQLDGGSRLRRDQQSAASAQLNGGSGFRPEQQFSASVQVNGSSRLRQKQQSSASVQERHSANDNRQQVVSTGTYLAAGNQDADAAIAVALIKQDLESEKQNLESAKQNLNSEKQGFDIEKQDFYAETHFASRKENLADPTQNSKVITVSLDGKSNFRSIQAAINSLPDSSAVPTIISIRNGIYKEKIYLEKHNVILRGQDRDKTIITQAIARDEWRCKHNDDWGVATFNLDANDITLENLTIINSYGRDYVNERLLPCTTDTSGNPKKVSKASHQMALRTMNATRMKAINCRFTAYGGDTVSPWNVEAGLFYFKDCIMEGGVDFYCPRGWAYAENCQFIVQSGTAGIWHDGSRYEDSKTVLKNCSFTGYDGFRLGRYHRDAQFYLINCRFPANMANEDIYLVPTTNEIKWGRRVYYYNCKRTGGDYNWHKNNLGKAVGSPSAEELTPEWVFDDRWPGFKPSTTNASTSTKHKGPDNNHGWKNGD